MKLPTPAFIEPASYHAVSAQTLARAATNAIGRTKLFLGGQATATEGA